MIILGLALGLGYWQQPGSAAGQASNKLQHLISPAAVSKAVSPKPRLASAKALNTITVTSIGDGPAIPGNCPGLSCRLRDAIGAAADGDTINFSVTGTIILNSGELGISKSLTIQGPGAGQLTVSGNQASRVFNIGSGVTVALSNLTITKGFDGGSYGGNIFNAGTLTITGSTISDGFAQLHGGGCWNQSSLTITNSTISGNSSSEGGGIFNQGTTLTLANTTITGNQTVVANSGGGIRSVSGATSLINCTITGNYANAGGGISNIGPSSPTYIRNTIIAGNTDSGFFGAPDVFGTFNYLGNNVIGGNPLLAPLGNYGGATQTHALLPGSPALNAGNNCVLTNSCASNNLGFNLTNDQRGAGFNRQVGGAVDIGAFESRGFTLAISNGDNQSADINTSFANPLAVLVTANNAGEPVQGGAITFTSPASGASATVAGNPAEIDSNGLTVSGIVTANGTAGNYTVQAGGPGLAAVSFNLSNIAPCSTLIISPAAGALPSGTFGTSYSQQFTQSGSAGPITWGITPAIVGLSINSTGLLSGLPIAAGTYNFDITATDANACLGSASYTLFITKANQTLTFGALANKTYGDAPFTVSAAASSGLLPNFSAAGNCTVSGGTVTLTGAGSCTVTASQPGDANYNAAPPVAQTFTIAKATATLTLSNLNQVYNGSAHNVSVATSPANLTGVSVTYSGSAAAPTNVGNYAVVASLTNANYQAANATGTLVITKGNQTITFGTLANKVFGDVPFTVSATASSGLPVSFSATGTCTLAGNTVTLTGAGSCTITAAQAGDNNWNAAANVAQGFTIAKANQTITFGTLANMTYGDLSFSVSATATSGLAVSFSATGNCTVTNNTVSLTGAGTCTITASQAGNNNYNAAPNVAQSFNVAKAAATLTLSNLSQTYNGTPRSVTVTTSPAGLTGVSVTYDGSAAAPTNAGSYAVVASLTNANYQATNATGTLVIAKVDQTITFGALASKTFGDLSFTVSATASSGLPVSFSATGACTVSGNTVTITGAGACSVAAAQAGNTNYNAAASVTQSFTIAKANQTITFGALASKTYGDAPFAVSATASSSLPVSFSTIGNCTVSGNTVTITGAGSCTVTASQAGNTNYNAAPSVSQSFSIAKATATLTLGNLNPVYTGAPRSVTVTTSPANLTGVNVTYNGAPMPPTNVGSYAVVASLNNANYQAANVTGTLVIAKGDQTIRFNAPANKVFGDAPFTVNATASSGLAVSFSATGNCTLAGNTVTLTAAGSCTITASQAGDANWNAAANVAQGFTIAKANQTITFAKLPDKTYGDAPFKLSATASSGLTVSFTASGVCTISLSTVTLTSAGNCTITATQAGNSNYNAATPVTQSFTIAKATQTITFAPLPDKTFGDPPVKLSATASSGLAVSFSATGSCTVSGNTVTLTRVGSCTVTASQAGDANYNAAPPVSQTFTVKFPCQPMTLGITSLPVGAVGANYSITLRSDLGLAPFQFTVSGLPSGLTASSTTTTVTIAGAPRQAGSYPLQINVVDANGCTNAGANSFTLVINKGTPYLVWNNPATIYCNTPLGTAQLNARAFPSRNDNRPLAGTFVYTPPPGTVLVYGTYTLSTVFTPTDTANWNSATASVPLLVAQKPYITLNADGQLTRNDHQYYTVTIDRMVASVTDGCATLDKNSVVVITSVTSDERDDIPGYDYDGNTINDIVIAPDCKSVQLRDERDTTQNGRVYKVTLRVITTGATAVFTVTAPNQGVVIDSSVDHTVRSNCWP